MSNKEIYSNEGLPDMQIKKRDGRITQFEKDKITNAIIKSLRASGKPDIRLAEELTEDVVNILLFRGYWNEDRIVPTVEEVQDLVEEQLLNGGYAESAKAYVVYRHEREKVRNEKMKVLNKTGLDEVDKSFDIKALRVLASRYLIRNENNEIIESPKQMFERIAIHIAIPEIIYDERIFSKEGNNQTYNDYFSYRSKLDDFAYKLHIGKFWLNKYHFEGLVRLYNDLTNKGHMKIGFKQLLTMLVKGEFDNVEKTIELYYNLMVSRDFLPNTPTLMNAGARLGQLSACFVLPMHDSMESIMKTATDAAIIMKSGGGIGINYSELRPKDAMVFSTSGVASGPVSFMSIINTITEVIKQGGKRRGANMGILDVDHKDIEEFITAKSKPGVLENFNVSVGMDLQYWFDLVTENGERTKEARQLFDLIAYSAWKSAEPGVIFFDKINEYNPLLQEKGHITATNPCGEQSLYPYESCNLGSINLSNFVKNDEFDFNRYCEVIEQTTRFLDNVIDMNKYPVKEIDEETKKTRRIGLGIMGLADTLYKLKVPYNSEKGYQSMEQLAEILQYYSMAESIKIAKERGAFPLCDKTFYKNGGFPICPVAADPDDSQVWDLIENGLKEHGIRNAWTTTIAPTGTLSMIANCSNGVEPVFAAAFEKRVTVGSFNYVNEELEKTLKEAGVYSEELVKKIVNNYGSLKGIAEIPEWIQETFVTAIDIHWTDHVMAQAVWQRWISNAIAKTINMPHDSTVDDVKNAYLLAHELDLKGITVYRDGSRHEQVLHINGGNNEKKFKTEPSRYVMEHIFRNIAEPYVKSNLVKMLEQSVPDKLTEKEIIHHIPISRTHPDTYTVADTKIEQKQNGHACPECKDELVVTEGCKMCISCGFSYCSSS